MVIVDRLCSLAFLITYWLTPQVMESEQRRGVAPFTTPLVVLCVVFEEKTLDGMLETFVRALVHVVTLRVLMAGAARWRGGPKQGEGDQCETVERDEEKNLISATD